jgi:hypothetical protein
LDVDGLVHVFVDLSDGVQELGLKNLLESRQLRGRNFAA